MAGGRPSKIERAKQYILAHPDESKEQQALGALVSTSLIATARKELIDAGLLPSSRKDVARAQYVPPPNVAPEPTPAQPSKPASMLDHQAMAALADIVDVAEVDEEDDAATHKRLMRQCLAFAFDTKLHPDTRMSASQMWAKLKDQARTKDLGPGPPMTFEAAVDRMSDMMVAAGAKVTLAAVNRVFEEKGDSGGKAANDQAPAPVGTPAPAGAA